MNTKMQLIGNFLCWPFRRKLKKERLINTVIVLDFMDLKDCFVSGSQVVYYGIGGFNIAGCCFVECDFVFAGPARNTIIANNLFAEAGCAGTNKTALGRNRVLP